MRRREGNLWPFGAVLVPPIALRHATSLGGGGGGGGGGGDALFSASSTTHSVNMCVQTVCAMSCLLVYYTQVAPICAQTDAHTHNRIAPRRQHELKKRVGVVLVSAPALQPGISKGCWRVSRATLRTLRAALGPPIKHGVGRRRWQRRIKTPIG